MRKRGDLLAKKESGIPVTIWKEGNWYVAYCPPVDIASQGKTPAEAKKNVIEALRLHAEEKGPAFKRKLLSKVSPTFHVVPKSAV